MLAERTEGDVRCCINTLQFLARQKRVVRVADVATAGAGHKDISKGAFDIWQQLFWLRVCSSFYNGFVLRIDCLVCSTQLLGFRMAFVGTSVAGIATRHQVHLHVALNATDAWLPGLVCN